MNFTKNNNFGQNPAAGQITEIMGIKINRITFKDALFAVGKFLESKKSNYIITLNAEMVLAADKDAEFRDIINNADLVTADGIGPIFAAAFLKRKAKNGFVFFNYLYNLFLAAFLGLNLAVYPKFFRREFPERISGVDLMLKIINKYQDGGVKIFLLGAKQNAGKSAAIKIKKSFPSINIAGVFEGDGSEIGDRVAVSIINQAKPDILFIAYGAPKQEKWIARNLKKMPSVKLAIGVGGAFDMISGKIKRAPLWMRNFNLEWLWRLFMEPRRIGRVYNATVKFTWLILTNPVKIQSIPFQLNDNEDSGKNNKNF